jgi:DNA-binding FadR family transcriptional regulator
MLFRVERRSLAEGVFRQIRDRILDGRLAAGSKLPGERDLSTQLGVNRNAVREALKRLEQLRLVAIHPGGATKVNDFRLTGGLDLLVALLFGDDGTLRLDAARSLVELRTALGPDIAARAAERGGPRRADELHRLVEAMAAIPEDDVLALERASLAVWRVLVDASENLAYRLAFNTMLEGWKGIEALVAPALADEVRDLASYRALVRAVGAGEVEKARRAATRLVEKGEQGLVRFVAGHRGDKKRGR